MSRQYLAATYHEDKRRSKLLRAYCSSSMSRFELMQLIKRLEQRQKVNGSLSEQDVFRLDAAREAMSEREKAGFELPELWDISRDASASYLRLFLNFGIKEMEARLEQIGQNTKRSQERDQLREQIAFFEAGLAKLGGSKPKAKVEDPDSTELSDDQPTKKKTRR